MKLYNVFGYSSKIVALDRIRSDDSKFQAYRKSYVIFKDGNIIYTGVEQNDRNISYNSYMYTRGVSIILFNRYRIQ